MENNSHKTAISRKKLPAPTRYLLEKGVLVGNLLDFGCGKCAELNNAEFAKYSNITSVTNYDPYHNDVEIKADYYDTVICNYVLNTLLEDNQDIFLKGIQKLLNKNGVAYIAVRTDTPKSGWGHNARGTYQRKVDIKGLFVYTENQNFKIYTLTKYSQY